MKRFIKFPLVLGIVGAVCAGALGLVHQVTDPIIQGRLSNQSLAAIQEIFPSATSAEEITETFTVEKLEGAGIVKVYEVKVNTTTAAYAYQASGGGWSGQQITIQFVVSATENKFLGMKVISHNETKGGNYGAILLESPLFAAQFVNLDVTEVTSSIQLVAGSTAGLTLGSVRSMANKVAVFHLEEIQGEETKEIPDSAFAELRFPEGTTYVDVTSYYENLAGSNLATVKEKTGIKYLYHAVDATNQVLGFVYYIDYTGHKVYNGYNEKSQQTKALFGFNSDYTNSKLEIILQEYSDTDATESLEDKVLSKFTADDISSWFTDVANVPQDVAAGVTITSLEINEIMKYLVQYHVQFEISQKLASKELADMQPAFEQLRFPAGTTYEDITADYEALAATASISLATITENTGIKYVYHAKDALNNVVGYVYYIDYTGHKVYNGYNEKSQQTVALFGFNSDYTNSKLEIISMAYSDIEATESLEDKVLSKFTADDISAWFANVTNVPHEVAAGVSITSHEFNDIMKYLVQYHVTLGVSTGG